MWSWEEASQLGILEFLFWFTHICTQIWILMFLICSFWDRGELFPKKTLSWSSSALTAERFIGIDELCFFLSFSRSLKYFKSHSWSAEKIEQNTHTNLLFFEWVERRTEDRWAVSSISENTQHPSVFAASLQWQTYCCACYHEQAMS